MATTRRRRAGFTGDAGTSAVFVRIPRAEAEKLDRAAFELKAPKQALIGALVARYVDPSSEAGLSDLRRLAGVRGTDDGSRRVVVESTDDALTVGRHDFRSYGEPEVLTADQAAELLQTEPETVLALADEGRLPARRVGEEWRFSRRAILDWLAGGDHEESEG